MVGKQAGVWIATAAIAYSVNLSEAGYFHETRQDHFDGSNDNLWQQEYFVNDTFWKGPSSGAPVFLCVGGEGPALDDSVTSASVHCNDAVEWLEETGALFLALQHRYYGCQSNSTACPVEYPIQEVKDMRFLSSRQALEDIALFHMHMVEEFHLTPTNRWVTFGGSYPGMLAAFARSKYPHLFYAAVSSSSPVQAALEMPGYYDYAARAYSEESVGGSQECRAKIALGHKQIGNIFDSKNATKLSELEEQFSLNSGALDSLDGQRNFAGNGVADFPSQGNDPLCSTPSCNIKEICKTMLRPELEPVVALATVRKEQQTQSFSSREQMRPRLGASNILETDLWSWQVCTEFGYLQTCNIGSECMFTQGLVTLDYMFTSSCSMYGFNDIERTAAAVVRSNVEYGGISITTPRILWIGGTVDPWLALSVQHLSKEQVHADQRMLLVLGASHHAWTHPTDAHDQSSVQDARDYLRHVVGHWLKEAESRSALA
mmetsp:Transcript_17151/g.33606  ORF Transcript_17151/g.33606 Transcript_17151/m.33606 type:complete len:488 (-) Transcript_17151:124-1587(-)